MDFVGIFRSGGSSDLVYLAQKINHCLTMTAEVYKPLPSCSIVVKILAHGKSSSIMFLTLVLRTVVAAFRPSRQASWHLAARPSNRPRPPASLSSISSPQGRHHPQLKVTKRTILYRPYFCRPLRGRGL